MRMTRLLFALMVVLAAATSVQAVYGNAMANPPTKVP